MNENTHDSCLPYDSSLPTILNCDERVNPLAVWRHRCASRPAHIRYISPTDISTYNQDVSVVYPNYDFEVTCYVQCKGFKNFLLSSYHKLLIYK